MTIVPGGGQTGAERSSAGLDFVSWGIMDLSMNPTVEFGEMHLDGASLGEVCRRYRVKELSLFGSVARGEMRPESDIDMMVEFEPGARVGLIQFEFLVEELAALAGRSVD